MPVVSTKEIVDRAFAGHYGVAAFNILDDLSIDAVLAAAELENAPVILQTSVKTVRAYGRERLIAVFRAMASDVRIPTALHLDHCPFPDVITECIDSGWNSVLFDAHELEIAENLRQTVDLVAYAHDRGAHVEGEIEGIEGKEDDIGSDTASQAHDLAVAVDFITRTGVDIFAPAIGNAHGQYKRPPNLNAQRVSDLVEATGVPMALHGGTGLSAEQFTDLIARGCAKVNISTALKESYMRSALESLKRSEATGKWDPPALFAHQRDAVIATVREHISLFGGSGAGLVTALLFDCDGVLADTERFGHLPAFNQTFAEFGVPARWTEDEYADKLEIGGGKERMASLFADPDFVAAAHIPADDEGRRDLLARWHTAKTAHFKQLVASGAIPPRSGIARVITGALAAGWTVAVCSTSAPESVAAVLRRAVGEAVAARVPLFAGDVVPAKKPDPAIYLLAVDELRLDPAATLVVEDSRNGLLAATRAGLRCVVTVNGYTKDETFDEADLVVSELGDPGSPPIEIRANHSPARPGDYLTLDDLESVLAGASTHHEGEVSG